MQGVWLSAELSMHKAPKSIPNTLLSKNWTYVI